MVSGCVYETFGISKRFPVKLQLLLIRAETLDKPLTAKCFIHDVVCRFFSIVKVLYIILSTKRNLLTGLASRFQILFYDFFFTKILLKHNSMKKNGTQLF